MKKLISFALALIIGIIVIAPVHEAEAQVVYTRKCCDSANHVRCVLENWTPVGNACFCYGQGWGYAC